MHIRVLHTTVGDKPKKIDTKSESGRAEAKKLIDSMLRRGTAIFLETARDTYRVVGYDPKRDTVIVRVDGNGKSKKVGRKGEKADKMTAVAPRAGG